MTLPKLTETAIRQSASAESFQRGRDYYQQGAVLSLVQRGTVLQAEVEGGAALPYIVQCTFDDNGAITATCTCPYDGGGWCKHIVATCLAIIHRPETIEQRLSLDTLLSGLDRTQLNVLVSKLAERDPSLIDVIEAQIALLSPLLPSPQPQSQPKATPPSPPVTPVRVDPKAVRRQVRSIVRSLDRMSGSEAYGYLGAVISGVGEVLDQAWTLIKADDGRNAITVLEAITEEYLAEWENFDDSDGEASDFFSTLGEAWTEALLSADMPDKEILRCAQDDTSQVRSREALSPNV